MLVKWPIAYVSKVCFVFVFANPFPFPFPLPFFLIFKKRSFFVLDNKKKNEEQTKHCDTHITTSQVSLFSPNHQSNDNAFPRLEYEPR